MTCLMPVNRRVGELPDEMVNDPCCEAPFIVNVRGTLICKTCGIVHEMPVVLESRTAYTNDEKAARIHAEPVPPYYSSTLSSTAGLIGGTFEIISRYKWLVRLQNTRCNADVRPQLKCYFTLRRMATSRSVPRVVEQTAWMMITKIIKKKYSRGHSYESVILASLFHACRVHGMAMFWHEFDEPGVNSREVRSAFSMITKRFGTRGTARPSMRDFVTRAGTLAGMPHEVIVKANKVLVDATSRGYDPTSKNPGTVAAALHFIAFKKHDILYNDAHVTQQIVARAFNITGVSLRNRVADILNALG